MRAPPAPLPPSLSLPRPPPDFIRGVEEKMAKKSGWPTFGTIRKRKERKGVVESVALHRSLPPPPARAGDRRVNTTRTIRRRGAIARRRVALSSRGLGIANLVEKNDSRFLAKSQKGLRMPLPRSMPTLGPPPPLSSLKPYPHTHTRLPLPPPAHAGTATPRSRRTWRRSWRSWRRRRRTRRRPPRNNAPRTSPRTYPT